MSSPVDLIVFGPGKVDVLITHRAWGGFWGPEGYIGYEQRHYRAGLRGIGPTFTNPSFQDNPPDIRCAGTITLDHEHNQVVIKMRRITSRSGEPERSKPHPASGAYIIQSTRQAKVGESSL
jgi:hypothetical protein